VSVCEYFPPLFHMHTLF